MICKITSRNIHLETTCLTKIIITPLILTLQVWFKYQKMQNSVSLSEMCSYVIELPVSEHGIPEVKITKKNQIKNLMDYNTFEEVADKGQEAIGSQRVITVKKKPDGQKQQCQA